MGFRPIQKLAVARTLSTGMTVAVGTLVQNRQGTFFQYERSYLDQFANLSPFTLKASDALQIGPAQPHGGIHGLFADSLPDGWGLLLQDRVFRQHGILPNQLTPMDRLAFVGQSAMGALSFTPVSGLRPSDDTDVDLATLGIQAQALFDGQTDQVLAALVAAGSSGGARPKAQIYIPPHRPGVCRTRPQSGDEAWLVKFTSHNLALGHEEGLCEAAYLTLAQRADLNPPQWMLLDAPRQSGASAWLAIKRFDRLNNPDQTSGRLHMHSACGLLDADFRTPSLDYADLIKASRQLCKAPATGQLQFRRAIFNLFAANQDDHSKNWSFLQDDHGQWHPAPFYDITFSPHPFNEHATSYHGYGKRPPLKAIQQLSVNAGYGSWPQAQNDIRAVAEAVSEFQKVANELGISKQTINAIQQVLEQRKADNHHLLA